MIFISYFFKCQVIILALYISGSIAYEELKIAVKG